MSRKTDLSDLTILIPVYFDSDDRLFNLNYTLTYITNNFNVKIIIGESGSKKRGPDCLNESVLKKIDEDKIDLRWFYFKKEDDAPFYRTYILNKLTEYSDTPLVATYDCDVFFPRKQYVETVELLRSGKVDACFPYDGRFYNVPKSNFNTFLTGNVVNLDRLEMFTDKSVGGSCFWNKAKYMEGGMQNPNFISWGCEDNEIVHRFGVLGYRIARHNGPLFHLDHIRFADSSDKNPFYIHNQAEYNRVANMDKNTLSAYVKNNFKQQ